MRRKETPCRRRGKIPRLMLRILLTVAGAILLFYLIVLITAWV